MVTINYGSKYALLTLCLLLAPEVPAAHAAPPALPTTKTPEIPSLQVTLQPTAKASPKGSPLSTPISAGVLPQIVSIEGGGILTAIIVDPATGKSGVFAPGEEVFGRFFLLEVTNFGVTLYSQSRTLITLAPPIITPNGPSTIDASRELFNFLTSNPPPVTRIPEIIKAVSLDSLLKNGSVAVGAQRWSKGAPSVLEDLLISTRKEARALLLKQGLTPSTLPVFVEYIRASIVAGDYKDLVSFSDAALGARCVINQKLAWTADQIDDLGRSLSSLILAVKGGGEVSKALKLAVLCDQSLKSDPRLLAYVKSGAAQVLLTENRMSEALSMYHRVLELAPNDRVAGAAYFWIALDAKSRGDAQMTEGAIAGLERAVGASKDLYDRMLITRAKFLRKNITGEVK